MVQAINAEVRRQKSEVSQSKAGSSDLRPLTPDLRPSFRLVPVDQIYVTKNNFRKEFDEAGEEFQDLVQSIRAKGVVQNLLVRDMTKWRSDDFGKRTPLNVGMDYDLIAGERRLRAAKVAGLTEVPCMVYDCDDATADELMILENMQRKDLHDLEYADGFHKMIKAHGYTVEQLATKVDKGKTYIRDLLRLSNLPDSAREAFRGGRIEKSHCILIATIPDEKQRVKYALEVIDSRRDQAVSVREAKEIKEREYMKDLKGAPFPLDDKTLDPGWGAACPQCVHYNGNTEESRQGKRPNICLMPTHYTKLVQLNAARVIANTKTSDTVKVLPPEQGAKLFFDSGYLRDQSFVETNGNVYDYRPGKGKVPIQQIVKQANAPVIVTTDGDGKLRTLIRKTDLNEATKKLSIKTSYSSSSPVQDKVAAAAKRKTNAVRRAVAARIVAQLGKLKAPNARLSQTRTIALAEWMIDKMGGASFLAKQLQLEGKKQQYGGLDWDEALLNHAKSLGSIALVPFMVQVFVVDVIESWALSDWGSGNPDKESVSLCKLFGVDVRKIQAEEAKRYSTEKAAKKKGAKKPAQKRERPATAKR